jgi:transglutaminase/protease-like cytokinesis protein 3
MLKWFFLIITLLIHLSIEAQISDFENINFENADKIAYSYKGNDLINLPKLSYNLTHDLSTDVEKFRAIYTWVCTNIESDYKGFQKNYAKRSKLQNDSLELYKWNKLFSSQVFKKLVKEKKTVCTGYAYLIQNLANLAHIKCEIIDGYGRTENTAESELKFPNHTWNAIQLNNKWYLCDATWSSGSYNLNTYSFEFNYNDGYFLADPELFAKNHFPNNSNWLLLNEKHNLSDFLNAPLLYDDAFIYYIFPIELSLMHLEVEKNKEIKFTLKELKEMDLKSIWLQISYGNNIQIIQPQVERLKDNLIKINYIFKSPEIYDVHITIKNHPICTYVVKVKR